MADGEIDPPIRVDEIERIISVETKTEHFQRLAVAMLGILCILGIGSLLIAARPLFVPFVLSVFLLYILNPLISILEHRGVPGGVAGVLSLIIVSILMATLGQMIGVSIQEFAVDFPQFEPRISALADSVTKLIPGAGALSDPSSSVFSAFDSSSFPGLIATLVRSIGSLASDALLVLLVLSFMLAGRNQLVRKIPIAFEKEMADRIVLVMTDVNRQVQQYIVVKSALSLLTAALFMLVLWLFGIKFVLVWGVLTFVLNFIPNVGSVIATILPLPLIQLESFIEVMWLAICLAAIQFIIGNLLDPKLVGDRIGISPVTILFALVAWSWMWGPVGMFLAVPITVLLKIIFENIPPLRFISILISSKPPSVTV
jgi:AI-2 transport protein TqsA